MAYLDDHPNRRLAQQRPRRDTPTGLIVVHTAESALDVIGEDTGAEGVARFISERTSYGSYHTLVDSDSIVRVARFEMTVYGDGTGSNDIAIHISFACRAADWPNMSAERRAAFIRNGAEAAAEAVAWVKKHYGITVPAERVTRAESDRRHPGFIPHGDRDPGRRTDPGPGFPWSDFLDEFRALTQGDEMNNAQEKKLDDVLEIVTRTERMTRTKLERVVKRLGRANELLRKSGRNDADVAEAVKEIEAALTESGDDAPRG